MALSPIVFKSCGFDIELGYCVEHEGTPARFTATANGEIRYHRSMKSTVRYVRRASHILFALVGVTLGACISPYRIEIQQGNYISRDAMSQVKPGMTKDQVRAIIGTPLINDIFHVDRWDYIFSRSAANRTDIETRKATLLFKGDVLKSIEADVMPPEPAKIVPESAPQKQ